MQYATDQQRQQWLIDLHMPLGNRDPDHVPEEVVEQEMSLFYSLKRQTEGGGA